MFRKLEWQIPGEPLAARYNWCQGPVPGHGPAVEKHWNIMLGGSREQSKSEVNRFFFWRDSSQWTSASSLTRFLDHTQRCTTVGRTPLDEWSARRRNLYLIKYTIFPTDKRPCPRWDSNRFRTRNLSRQAAAGLSLRPRRHWVWRN